MTTLQFRHRKTVNRLQRKTP